VICERLNIKTEQKTGQEEAVKIIVDNHEKCRLAFRRIVKNFAEVYPVFFMPR